MHVSVRRHLSRRQFSRSRSSNDVPPLAQRAWHARGLGDFWAHMLVAEGAVDGAVDAIGVSELGPRRRAGHRRGRRAGASPTSPGTADRRRKRSELERAAPRRATHCRPGSDRSGLTPAAPRERRRADGVSRSRGASSDGGAVALSSRSRRTRSWMSARSLARDPSAALRESCSRSSRLGMRRCRILRWCFLHMVITSLSFEASSRNVVNPVAKLSERSRARSRARCGRPASGCTCASSGREGLPSTPRPRAPRPRTRAGSGRRCRRLHARRR